MSSTTSDRGQGTGDSPFTPPDAALMFPVTFQQRRLWFLDQLDPGSSTYNITWSLRMRGVLDPEALQASINEIVRRHEVLRTTFPTHDGEPVQLIHPEITVDLPLVDLGNILEVRREAEAQRIVSAEAKRPMDLVRGPLVRASLLRLAEQDHVLVLSTHHIVFDGWSRMILIRELATLYDAFASGRELALPPLRLQYADFAVWQREQLLGETLNRQLSYWKQQLTGAPANLDLPTDRPRPAVQSYQGANTSVTLPRELTEALHRLSKEESVTLFMTLLAGFQALLCRYCAQEDVVVGIPMANRTQPELEELIGFFANTLALRTDLTGNPSFRELLARVKEVALGAYANQDMPFEKLVEELRPERSVSHNPIFQVLFSLQNAPRRAFELKGLALTPLDSHSGMAKFDLSLFMHETPEGLVARAEFNTDLFDASTINRMLGHFRVILEAATEDPELRLAQLPLVTESERDQLLFHWNSTHRNFPADKCLHQLFESQAESKPDQVAVTFAEAQLTYRQLNERSNQVANFLMRKGVGRGSIVGLYVERSLEMVIGLLGIQKSGAAYVPLDPGYPKERLRIILEDSGIQTILTQQALLPSMPEHLGAVFCLDEWSGFASESSVNASAGSEPQDLVYVIFTSGSTGRPKGVQVPHRAVINLLSFMQQELGIGDQDVVPSLASFAFDMSIPELYLPLIAGGRLLVVPRETTGNGEELRTLLQQQGVTLVHATPTSWRLLLDAGFTGKGRKRVIGAEPLPQELFLRLMESGEPLYNFYGPTETTVWSTFQRFTSPDEPVTIGRPLANTQVYLLDRNLQVVPIGVPGEIHIAGSGVTQGYLSRPDLTAEKFIPDPFSSDSAARMYKTGDLGRHLPDGRIEFLGRADNQVKVRGFRIELGDIEAGLSAHPTVKEAVVVAREDRPGDKRLVAYVIAGVQGINVRELRNHLKDVLPEYMVPATFVVLQSFPLNANGKVDRRALPAPDVRDRVSESDLILPRTPTEGILAEIWAEVMELDKIGVEDNFFDLGGHSMLATQVISRIRRTFQLEIPLRVLFEAPTVAALSERIDAAQRSAEGLIAPPLIRVSRNEKLPLSFGQQRLWFLDRLDSKSPVYNIPLNLRLEGELDVEVLERSLTEVIRRHEVLRVNITALAGEPVQTVRPAEPFALPITDLSQLSAPEARSEALRLAGEEASRGFDLQHEPLLRGSLLRLAKDDHVLLLTVHHMVFDGWSINLFLHELAVLYEAFSAGEPSPLADPELQYVDFAAWQRTYLQGDALHNQVAYWKQQLAGAPPSLDLPTDHPRPRLESYRGARDVKLVSQDLTQDMRALGRREGVTLFMSLFAAFNVLLSRYSGQSDLVVGTPIASRNRAEIEKLIGFFVNTLVLRSDLSGNPSFRELLARVRETTLAAYAHQEVPFEKLVEEIRPERDLSRHPIFQAMFILQNTPKEQRKIHGLTISPFRAAGTTAKFDLLVSITETSEGLRTSFEYNRDLFEAETIARMKEHWQSLLEGVVANPDAPITEIPLLSQAERQQLVTTWNNTETPFARDVAVQQLFERQVCANPDATAVTFGKQALSYRELNERANQVARYLRKAGAGPNTLVGIHLERSAEMLVAVLGVLKAGAAYVPLDPAYPADRIAFIVEDAQLGWLLSQQSLVGQLPAHAAQVVRLDADWPAIASEAGEDLAVAVKPEDLAYVLYTSGSTGKPKGVQIEHRNLVNFLSSMQLEPGLGKQDVLLAVTTLSFDIAGLELLLPLTVGARIVLATREQAGDGIQLRQMLSQGITVMQATPATWRLLIESGWTGQSNLKILCGGEALPHDLAEQLLPRCGELWNMYGPTETTIWSSLYRVRDVNWSVAPIGRPIGNTQMYVLDKQLQLLPVGVPGELYIGGEGVARGYWNRPQLSAEKFIPDPFRSQPGARLYRTGDLVRYLPDGNLQYLGRLDTQVKVRGFRIELGEIESVLGQHPAVQQGVVVVREDTPGDKRLVAYIVGDAHLAASEELRAYLKQSLPEYMLPSQYVVLDSLPLTPNGKVDRNVLPKPDYSKSPSSTLVAPRNQNEKVLLDIWKEILGMSSISVTDNFFEIGGHSLLAVRLLSEVKKLTGKEIPLAALFQGATIEFLATVLGEGASRTTKDIVVEVQGKGTRPPFFAIVIPGANSLGYVQLSRYLGEDQPFYKIQGTGPAMRDRPYTSREFEQLADEYIQALRKVQAHGPYYLGGMCEGARIAFDIARILDAQGEKVAFLGIFDTWVVENSQRRFLWYVHYYRQRLQRMRKLTSRQRLQMVNKSTLSAGKRLLRIGKPNRSLWAAAYWPGKAFTPEKYRGDITLFKIPKQPFYYVRDPFMGWGNRTLGKVKIYSIAARHNYMLREPYVQDLAQKLQQCLAAVDERTVSHVSEKTSGAAASVSGAASNLSASIGRFDVGQTSQLVKGPERQQMQAPPSCTQVSWSSAAVAWPLTVQQQRLWLLEQLEHTKTAFHVPLVLRLKGSLDRSALENAVASLLSRHLILCSRVSDENGDPLWTAAPPEAIFDFVDEREIRRADREQHVRQLVTESVQETFDLDSGPLLRARLLQISSSEHILILVAHGIVCDSTSAGILLRDLAALYESLKQDEAPDLPDLKASYQDFATSQRLYLESEAFESDLAYWKRRLSGVAAGLELPTDHPRPPRASFSAKRIPMVLEADVAARLQKFALQHGSRVSTVLLTAFIAILSRYSSTEDIVLGVENSGRSPETTEAVGLFADTLPLRTDLSGNPTFLETMERVCLAEAEAWEHQSLPFGSLVQNLNLDRDLSRNPLFQVVFAYRDLPSLMPQFSDLKALPVPLEQMSEMFDLTLSVVAREDKLEFTFSYSTELFEDATISRMIGHFRVLLDSVLEGPDGPISGLRLLPETERHQLIADWNRTQQSSKAGAVHQMIEEQAIQAGSAIALTIGSNQISYRELNERANQVARYLRKAGAGPNTLVGIYLERSAEMLVAVLGVLKAGAAYVPLDPAYPADRIAFIVEDAQLGWLLSQQSLVGQLPAHAAQVVRLDADWPAIASEAGEDLAVAVKPEDLAYVLYTSGSTGKPKGVQIEHRNLVNFLSSMQLEPGLGKQDVLLAVTTLSFDIAGLELLLPLTVGARIVLATREQAGDGIQLRQMLSQGITVMQATPATWRLLIESGWTGQSNLKILCGGEALPHDLAEQLLPRCGELWNMYGPTETTIWSSLYRVRDVNWSVAPIGRPIGNTQMYVLDKQLQLLPVGVAGELYIGGEGVARGYWNRPQLSAEKFIPDPFRSQPGARLYRTGDLVRYLPDGNLQYLGRLDTQVKVRGFRIELGEIESVLGQHPAVQQGVVVVREDTPGDKRLVAYIVGDTDLAASEELRAYLKQSLPEYMLPSQYVVLDSLPLTPNGKVDRNALPKPKREFAEKARAVSPRDDLEASLVHIWENVLGVRPIGINEDFFELGGHSLMAAHMLSEVRNLTRKDLPLSVLFQGANVEYLAKVLRNGVPSLPHQTVTEIQLGDSSMPPFFAIVSPGESALGYAMLARHMGTEHTVYKIQSEGPIINDSERPYTPAEMDSLANHYISAMRAVQPEGPYFFGGMCDGAHIALRMAHKLEQRGQKVGMLAIFDTWVLEHSQRQVLWLVHYCSERFNKFRTRPIREQVRIVSRIFRNLLWKTLGVQKRRSAWSEAYWPDPRFVAPTFNGRLTLFKRPNQPYYYVNDPEMGWGMRAAGGVDVHVLSIQHNEMLREPHVEILGTSLSQCLRQAWTSAGLALSDDGAMIEASGTGSRNRIA